MYLVIYLFIASLWSVKLSYFFFSFGFVPFFKGCHSEPLISIFSVSSTLTYIYLLNLYIPIFYIFLNVCVPPALRAVAGLDSKADASTSLFYLYHRKF